MLRNVLCLASTHTHTHTEGGGGLSGPSAQKASARWGFSSLVRQVEAQRRQRALRLSSSGALCAQKGQNRGGNCGPYFLNPSSRPSDASPPLVSPAAPCLRSAASTACCSATSWCTRRPAARPSPARSPAARPGRGSTASGTAPEGPACPGRATGASSSSSRPPATADRVGDALATPHEPAGLRGLARRVKMAKERVTRVFFIYFNVVCVSHVAFTRL